MWIVLLSLVGLAVSSWVKWRVIATGSDFRSGLCAGRRGRHRQRDSAHQVGIAAECSGRDVGAVAAAAGRACRYESARLDLPTSAIVAMLVLACLVCVAVLNARIRAREVVRG